MNEKIERLLGEMTLEEKAGLCSGLDFWHTKPVERLGVQSIMMTDGPHGLRKQEMSGDEMSLDESVPATCFPSGAGLAATWNRKLLFEVGSALGRESRANDVAIILGPAVNIKRNPLCGRNFEYFSEDPYLAGELACAHIQGVQSEGVGTSLKHFAANNQEHNRMTVDAIVDERTLREIYLPAFETAVRKASPWTVMCAYNRLNGVFASEHPWLLSTVLRDEWGFRGFVMSDWGAVNDRVEGIKAGLDLEMPSSSGLNDRKIVDAVRDGRLSVSELDRAARRILEIVFAAVEGLSTREKPEKSALLAADHELARRVAAESIVLLKNDGRALPLSPKGSIAFIGAFAERPRYQGGGSSHINPSRLESALEEAKKIAGESATIRYARGYSLDTDAVDPSLLDEAVRLAKESDVAVVFAGLTERFESEGFDRTHLGIPENHRTLIEALAAAQKNTIVVLSNGSPVEMPWIDRVPAVLETYLGGQAWGGAVCDVLFGRANPSGKLAETFPLRLEDTPSFLNFPGDGRRVEYREGIFVGYRGHEALRQRVLFPFGHGLSYTKFEYSPITLSASRIGENDTLTVGIDIRNAGDRRGQEIVQLYVGDAEASVLRPGKELKGFEKVDLQPGETTRVQFALDRRAFAFWHPALGGWRVESGRFDIMIGSSSADIRQVAAVEMSAAAWTDFAYDRNASLEQIIKNPRTDAEGLALLEKVRPLFGKNDPGSIQALMVEAMIRELPLRTIVHFSGGAVLSDRDLEELLGKLNG